MKKTIKKRAFVSAIAMLIVSAIVLTSSTFAWFSMSKEATVEKMDLTVSSPEGIQISANASAWTASLTNDDFFNEESTSRYKAYDGNTNLMPKDLIPVSSYFGEYKDGAANFFKATLDDTGYATVTAVEQTAGNDDVAGLVAFDIFFKVANETKVYFGTSEFTDESSSDILTALRVAFSEMGNTSSTVAADAISCKSPAADKSYMYEVDTENRSADAVTNGNSTGYIQTKYVGSTQASFNVSADKILTNGFCKEAACTEIKSTAADTDKSFTLQAGVTKMRIYIWVEGNDIDCRNSVAGAALSVALKFTID